MNAFVILLRSSGIADLHKVDSFNFLETKLY